MNRKKMITALAISILLLGFQANAGLITTTIDVSGTINGEAISGAGASVTENGNSDTTIFFNSLPTGFPVIAYGKSWRSGHHPSQPIMLSGAVSFNDLSPLGYDFSRTHTYSNGDQIFTNGIVRTLDTENDTLSLFLSGIYTGPTDAVGILDVISIYQNIGPGVIQETVTEIIILSDNSTFEIEEVTIFTLLSGANFPDGQVQALDVKVDQVNFSNGVLQLNTNATFSVVPEPSMLALFGFGFLCFELTRRSHVNRHKM